VNEVTREEFSSNQLKEEIERLIVKHRSDLSEKDDVIRELRAAIRTKRRVEEVVHAEYTQEYFPRFIITALNLLDPKKKLSFWYIKMMSLLNYMLVCSIGVIINMYVLYAFIGFLPLWLANLCAIFTAFTWNWTFTVGPLGYFMGLSPRKKKVMQT